MTRQSNDSLALDEESITKYLQENPAFLYKYVVKHVDIQQLEVWTKTKKHFAEARNDSETIWQSDSKSTGIYLSKDDWRISSNEDKQAAFRELNQAVHQHDSNEILLHDLCSCVANVIKADDYSVHEVDEFRDEVRLNPRPDVEGIRPHLARKIGPGSTTAAYVADTKYPLFLNGEQINSKAHPEGIGDQSIQNVHSVISQPILKSESGIIAVMEFYRYRESPVFNVDDEERSTCVSLWSAFPIVSRQMNKNIMKQRKLNDFLLAVTKSIFQDIVSMDAVIMKIMNFAKRLVNADRTALFLVEIRSRELYARVFDMGDENSDNHIFSNKGKKEIRFPMDKGVAGYVATTGEILNIKNAYSDARFNREVDQQTGYHTKTILCMPISIRGTVIGVVQMVNKLDGYFTKADEEAFETFAVYCGLALHHAKLYDKIRRSEQKFKVALEVLSYHNQSPDEEVAEYMKKPLPQPTVTNELIKYETSPWAIPCDEKPLYVIHMFKVLFKDSRPVDPMVMYRFVLTVRKNYRHVPYHNWEHGFSVAHAMFTILKTTTNTFTPLQSVTAFVACLCHDVDHRGYTNQFMVKSEQPLAALYSTSTMERHHFNQTISILQNEGHNIFRHLTSEEYKTVLGEIRHCILATDLALFFQNRAEVREIVDMRTFDWSSQEHKNKVLALCMTASDLCSMYKPWDLQLELVHVIMEEFWLQGDEEKRLGQNPIPMMDRSKSDQLPSSQVGFIVGICLPCYELLATLLPECKPMVEGAQKNLKRWKALAEEQKEREFRESKIKKGSGKYVHHTADNS